MSTKNQAKVEKAKQIYYAAQKLPVEERVKLFERLPEPIWTTIKNLDIFRENVYNCGKDRYLAVSVVNMQRKHEERVVMTGLIGFLYRMLDEWDMGENPILDNYTSENDAKFSELLNKKMKLKEYEIPMEKYEKQLDAYYKKYPTILEIKKYKPLQKSKTDGLSQMINDFPDYFPFDENIDELINDMINYFDTYLLYQSHIQYYASTNYEKLERRLQEYEQTKRKIEASYKSAQHVVQIAKRRKELFQQFLDSGGKKNNKNLAKYNAAIDTGDINYGIKLNKIELRKMDYNRTIDVYDTEIQNAIDHVDMFEKDLNKISGEIDEFKEELNEAMSVVEDTRVCIANAKQVCKLFEHQSDNFFDPYDLTDEEYQQCVNECKTELGIYTTKEEKIEECKDYIQDFMDHFLVYNPDLHVKSGYHPDFEDEFRNMLVPVEHDEYETMVHNYQEAKRKYREYKETEYECSLIPPEDTFARLHRYMDQNYENIRQAVIDIYGENAMLEFIIEPYEVFDNLEDADKWKRKYVDELGFDVLIVQMNQRTMMASWEQNREALDYYSKNTEIIKKMIDKASRDEKISKDMTKKRMEVSRKKNEKEHGKMDSSINYNNPTLESLGAKQAKDYVSDSDLAGMDKKKIENTIIHHKRYGKNNRRIRPVVRKGYKLYDAENDIQSASVTNVVEKNPLVEDFDNLEE